ncbi:hypothetical protein GQR58_029767 [Nymphon striatum]|nr:hypothetical protein GQR58_029767 [Nymphon striatum]
MNLKSYTLNSKSRKTIRMRKSFLYLDVISFLKVVSQWQAILTLALLTLLLVTPCFGKFQHFTITTASILSSVQPVYGIIIGAIFLSEYPTWTTILGGVLILTAVWLKVSEPIGNCFFNFDYSLFVYTTFPLKIVMAISVFKKSSSVLSFVLTIDCKIS